MSDTSNYNGVQGATPPPSGGTTTTKQYIGVTPDYKAQRTKQVEYDALGRIIVADGAPIADPTKEVHRSDATMEIKSTHAEKVPTTRGEPTITKSAQLDKNGRVVGYEYWINGRHATRQTVKGKKGQEDTYRYYWDDGKEVDLNKVEKTKTVPTTEDKWVTSTDKGLTRTEQQQFAVDPKYFQGDQYRPASMPPEKIAELQRKMIDAGVLAQGYTTFGRWDEASSSAYEKILGYANQQGLSDDEIMEQWKKFGSADGAPGKQLTLKNPEEVAATVREAAAKILGRSMSDAEVQQLVAGYQSLDRAAKEQAAAADATATNDAYKAFQSGTPYSGAVTTSTEPISIETYAENKIRSEHKGESQFMTGIDRMNSFYSMLGEAV